MDKNTDHLIHLQELALGSRLKRLSDQLMREVLIVYNELNIDFDPYHMPIFKLISEQNKLTISEISESINVTQPATTQYVNTLIIKNLIVSEIGKHDKRKRKISLSKKGEALLNQMRPIWFVIDSELKKLTHQKQNKTLLDHITYVESRIKEQAFHKSVLSELKVKSS